MKIEKNKTQESFSKSFELVCEKLGLLGAYFDSNCKLLFHSSAMINEKYFDVERFKAIEDFDQKMKKSSFDFMSNENSSDLKLFRFFNFYIEEKNHLMTYSIGFDVSELNLLLSDLEECKQEKEELKKSQHVFMSELTHHIRTALNGINGFAELLKYEKNNIDVSKNENVEPILQISSRLKYLLNNVLDSTNVANDVLTIHYNEIDLNKFLKDLSESFSLELKNTQASLLVKYGLPEAYSSVIMDSSLVFIILDALLHNAFAHTSSNQIELGYKLVDKSIQLYIKEIPMYDSFPENNSSINKLFNGFDFDFQKLSRLSDLMNCRLWVETERGYGNTSFLSIPYKVTAPVKRTVTGGRPVTADYIGKKVLLVEDDVFSVSVMKKFFSGLNLDFVHTSLGKEALEICRIDNNIDLVLMDIRLPDILGTEVAAILKRIKPDIVIIAQTANAMPEDKEVCFNAGCDDYITKPINFDVLKKLLYHYLIEVDVRA